MRPDVYILFLLKRKKRLEDGLLDQGKFSLFYLFVDTNIYSILYRFTYKSAENQRVLSRLIDEVKALNSQFITQHIRGIL